MQLKKNAPSNDVVKKLAAAGVLSAEEEPIPSSSSSMDSGKPQVQKEAYVGPSSSSLFPSSWLWSDVV